MKKKLNKFFVSSTFVDMHQERDELLKKVFPAFREESNAHAIEVEMIELRWGLDSKNLQDEALVSRIVGTCLSEIDRSRPFLLVYLSERWGWVPPRQFIPEELASKFHEDIDGKSVTALEIDYALKEKGLDQEKDLELPRCIICLRDLSGTHIPDKLHDDYFEKNPDNRQKLKDLKEWLRETFNDSIIEYTAEFDPTKKSTWKFPSQRRKSNAAGSCHSRQVKRKIPIRVDGLRDTFLATAHAGKHKDVCKQSRRVVCRAHEDCRRAEI